MAGKDTGLDLRVFGYAALFIIPSLDTFLKYFGTVGVLAYFLGGTLLLGAIFQYLIPRLLPLISERDAKIAALFTLAAVIAIVLVLYPIANSTTPDRGSDADDALIVTGTELLRGNYPYYARTYLGNYPSPMPGAILLAMPFVITGLIQFQNIVWLVVFFAFSKRIIGDGRLALMLVLAILVFSPTVFQNLVTASDYTANSIYVLLFTWLLVQTLSDPRSEIWARVGTALLFGIGLSSRSNFFLIIPLVMSTLVQTAGWATTIRYLSISGAAFLALTVPFWLYDSSEFAPFIVQSQKVRDLGSVLPYSTVLIPAFGIVLAFALSLRRYEKDCRKLFLNCAIVQVTVLLFTSALYTVKLGRLDLFIGQPGYGIFTLFFGALAAWMTLFAGNREAKIDPQTHQYI